MPDIADKILRQLLLGILKKGKEDCREGQKIMHERNRMTDKDKENIKRNQKEILELKSKITEILKFTRVIQRSV